MPQARFVSFAGSLILSLFVMSGAAPAQEKKEEPKKAAEPAKKEEKKEEKKMPPGSQGEIAVVETNQGTFKLKFFPDVAPKAVENFIGLAQKGFYNGVTFHRVIDGFMIQGGDPSGTGSGGKSLWGTQFEDEFGPKYRFDRKGLLAMANSGPRTNGSQFFVTLAPTPHLDKDRPAKGHTIFGEVIEGMDIVEKIGKVRTGAGSKPLEAVVMKKVTIEIPKPDEKKAPEKK